MDLKPLQVKGDLTLVQFAELFSDRLGDDYPRAMEVLRVLGEMHFRSVASVVHLALQAGNVEEVLSTLEQWCEIARMLPDPCPTPLYVRFHADTKVYFDGIYSDLFFQAGHTVDGVPVGDMLATAEDIRLESEERGRRINQLVLPGQLPVRHRTPALITPGNPLFRLRA